MSSGKILVASEAPKTCLINNRLRDKNPPQPKIPTNKEIDVLQPVF